MRYLLIYILFISCNSSRKNDEFIKYNINQIHYEIFKEIKTLAKSNKEKDSLINIIDKLNFKLKVNNTYIGYHIRIFGNKFYSNNLKNFSFSTNQNFYKIINDNCIEIYEIGELKFINNLTNNNSVSTSNKIDGSSNNIIRVNISKEGLYDINLFFKNKSRVLLVI